jgi:predicted ATPase
VDRARLSQPGFAVTTGNAAAVAQVCGRLDGIPLAIELAAARIKALSVERIAERLDDSFRLLTGGSRTALPRHQTLRALIDWSHDLLSEPEQTLLRRLSVFAGGWTLEAAEAVCAGLSLEPQALSLEKPASDSTLNTQRSTLPLEEWQVLDLLTSLVDKSLVVYEGSEEEDRYRLPETIRQYARERLLAFGEASAVRVRHLDWVVVLAEQAGPELFGPNQTAWLHRLAREHDNLRAALDWSLESEDAQAGLRIGASVWRFWHMLYHVAEGRERLAAALSRPEALEARQARARALDGAGVLAIRDSDYAGARAHYEEMLAIGRELGDKQIMAAALNGLGHGPLQQGHIEQARSFLEQGLALAREAGDQWEVAFSVHALGMVAADHGDHAAAWSLCEKALALRRELGDNWSVFFTLDVMAILATRQGDYRRAQVLFGEALAIARELGGSGIDEALYYLGDVARHQGDYAAARRFFEESGAIAREGHRRRGLANALDGLGQVALQQGDFEAARSLFEESRANWREMGTPSVRAGYPLRSLGDVARYQGDFTAARALYEEALTLWRENLRMRPQRAALLLELAIMAQEEGDHPRAADLCRESRELFREVGETGGKAETAACLEAWGSLAAAQGHSRRAARLLGAAAALREAIGALLPPVDLPAQERSLAAVRAALGDDAFAAAWAEGRAMPLDTAVEYALEAPDA